MARYIDADWLWNSRPQPGKTNDPRYIAGFNDCMAGFSESIRKHIDNYSADVVPKSEVKRLEKENAELLVSETTDILVSMEKLYRVRVEHPIFKAIEEKVAREIFEEVDSMLELVSAMIGLDIIAYGGKYAELKKKYTEGDK